MYTLIGTRLPLTFACDAPRAAVRTSHQHVATALLHPWRPPRGQEQAGDCVVEGWGVGGGGAACTPASRRAGARSPGAWRARRWPVRAPRWSCGRARGATRTAAPRSRRCPLPTQQQQQQGPGLPNASHNRSGGEGGFSSPSRTTSGIVGPEGASALSTCSVNSSAGSAAPLAPLALMVVVATPSARAAGAAAATPRSPLVAAHGCLRAAHSSSGSSDHGCCRRRHC